MLGLKQAILVIRFFEKTINEPVQPGFSTIDLKDKNPLF